MVKFSSTLRREGIGNGPRKRMRERRRMRGGPKSKKIIKKNWKMNIICVIFSSAIIIWNKNFIWSSNAEVDDWAWARKLGLSWRLAVEVRPKDALGRGSTASGIVVVCGRLPVEVRVCGYGIWCGGEVSGGCGCVSWVVSPGDMCAGAGGCGGLSWGLTRPGTLPDIGLSWCLKHWRIKLRAASHWATVPMQVISRISRLATSGVLFLAWASLGESILTRAPESPRICLMVEPFWPMAIPACAPVNGILTTTWDGISTVESWTWTTRGRFSTICMMGNERFGAPTGVDLPGESGAGRLIPRPGLWERIEAKGVLGPVDMMDILRSGGFMVEFDVWGEAGLPLVADAACLFVLQFSTKIISFNNEWQRCLIQNFKWLIIVISRQNWKNNVPSKGRGNARWPRRLWFEGPAKTWRGRGRKSRTPCRSKLGQRNRLARGWTWRMVVFYWTILNLNSEIF